ncbi:glycosyltransferase [Pseudoalteromonas sp. JC28]|uniref:glycosyltransferase n=1 Tax=Pseudoalteromonas sp. JC28 TaxID=2267617 RepID=UPI001574A87C|nr:glycosyltransferase [Pseudoalteromonas sp. JC28]NSY35195.1 glycosyltransferase [Pseudoalteromonas sp. JC28]
MKILINASNLKVGGAIQVATSIVNQISEKENIYTVLLSPAFLNINFDKKSNVNIIRVDYPPRFNFFGYVPDFDNIVSDSDSEVVFTVFGPSYWKPKVKHYCGFAQGYYLYKHLPFFKNQGALFKLKLSLLSSYHRFLLKNQVDDYFVETQDVQVKLGEYLGVSKQRVHIASNTYSAFFESYKKGEVSRVQDSNVVKLLTVAFPYPHKNILIYKEVVDLLVKNTDKKFLFYITVPEDYYVANFEGYEEYIINFGKVNNSECPALYDKSDFMILPSLVECFSASYPEAMYMGKPILTSDYSFARSICGDAAIYFDPLSASDIYNKIVELAMDKDKQCELIAKGMKRLSDFDSPQSRFQKYINEFKR